MNIEAPIKQLSVEETLEFLATKDFGRLAITLDGKPDIFPINFAVHANSVDDVVAYIRTSPGNKLFATPSFTTSPSQRHLIAHRHQVPLSFNYGAFALLLQGR